MQRKCACGGTPGPNGECAACRRKRLMHQSQPLLQDEHKKKPETAHHVSSSPDQSGTPAIHSFREFNPGHNFSRMRVEPDTDRTPTRALYSINSSISGSRSHNGSERLDAERHPTPALSNPQVTVTKSTLRDTNAINDRTAIIATAALRSKQGRGSGRRGSGRTGGGCRYIIHAASPIQRRCGGIICGGRIFVRLLRVTTAGEGCPSLEGRRLTEEVRPRRVRRGEQPCPPTPVETGEGCLVNADGTFTNPCGDQYSVCGGANRFPLGTCTTRYVQRYFIDGRVVANNEVVFRITKRANPLRCTGQVLYYADPNLEMSPA